MTCSNQLNAIRVTVDCVVFGLDETGIKALLIQRGIKPFKDSWALPGGFVLPDESIDDAARRELAEEAGLKDIFLEQLYTFGELDRDPRGRVVTIAYYALVNLHDHNVVASSDASNVAWFALEDVPELAFDHTSILESARDRLRGKVSYKPIGFELLPPKFTLSQLQYVYEAVLNRPLDKRNFRKKVLKTELLIDLNEIQKDVAHRAARLYRFDQKKYRKLERKGFNFEI